MISNILLKVLIGILTKLLTEKFLAEVIIYCLQSLAKSTDNKLDDAIVVAVAKALNIELPKEIKN